MKQSSHRLDSGGAIDRSQRIAVTFDGRTYEGHPGDTLASLLLANGVRLLGRSFKYHRPRGPLAAGLEEPNALVELRERARREPNTRATTIEVFDGLSAASQNNFPSLSVDLLAVNRLFSRFLIAGFYYKTFMWPAALWESLYERQIRRAAGLGRAATEPDPDHYEHTHTHADVVVVGAGPAGLMATLAAGHAGARVLLVEERPWLGGRLAFERDTLDGQPAAHWLAATEAELERLDNVRVLRRTAVTGAYDHRVLAAVERVSDHLPEPSAATPRQRLWTLRAQRVVLATGAFERPFVFDDNDAVGVMLACAVRAYLNRFAVAAGTRFVVATNNDVAYRTAFDLADQGLEVAAIVDAREEIPTPLAEPVRRRRLRVITGAVPGRAKGTRSLRAIEVRHLDDQRAERVACDCLAVSGGYNPDLALFTQAGGTPVWNETLAAFVSGEHGVAGYECAGASAGTFDLAGCLEQGFAAGRRAAQALDRPDAQIAAPRVQGAIAITPLRPVWRCPGGGKAFVDLQNDVTAADITLAHREGFVSVEHVKRYTTLGMATDQGKTSSINAMALMALERGEPIPAVGTTRLRPPTVPVAIGALAGHRRGVNYAPIRRTAMHQWHRRHDATFVEAGHWLRPNAYPRRDEDLAAATRREAAAVRQSVGICDVSTLGKIDVYGPDAAAFLNRVYINGFAKLPMNKARYGAMLRPDGHLFDDGTTSRLADDHFVMTTTTANAGPVLTHLEFHLQVAWPELDVAVCSATEQWATMAVAGPNSRRTLQTALPEVDLSNDALPFMGCTVVATGAYPIRVFRISFSGELAYEVSVPWGYGETMWERIMTAGQPYSITPYGTEALSVLRIKKGHPAGPEFDGRTTAGDIGLGGMLAAQKKDFVGKALAAREGLNDPGRPRLVGLQAIDPAPSLRGGAHLITYPKQASLEQSQGWLSSVAYSPHVNGWIALAFLRGGEARRGEIMHAAYPLRDELARVRVVGPVFLDREGSRLRG